MVKNSRIVSTLGQTLALSEAAAPSSFCSARSTTTASVSLAVSTPILSNYKVVDIEYDPNRTSKIALIKKLENNQQADTTEGRDPFSKDKGVIGEYYYVLATDTLKKNQIIQLEGRQGIEAKDGVKKGCERKDGGSRGRGQAEGGAERSREQAGQLAEQAQQEEDQDEGKGNEGPAGGRGEGQADAKLRA